MLMTFCVHDEIVAEEVLTVSELSVMKCGEALLLLLSGQQTCLPLTHLVTRICGDLSASNHNKLKLCATR